LMGYTLASGGYYLEEDIYFDHIVLVYAGSSGRSNVTSSFPGGTDVGTTLLSGGLQFVDWHGTAISTTIGDSGFQTLFPGGTALSTTITGGEQDVLGGTVSGTVINSGGGQYLFATTVVGGISQGYYVGSAFDTTIGSGGNQVVEEFAIASDTIVSGGGVQTIGDGGSAFATTIGSGGRQYVLNALDGMAVVLGGFTSDTLINSGGVQYVSSNSVASATTVSGGGTVNVYSGGTTVSALVVGSGPNNRAFETLSGGTASGTVLSDTGVLNVSSGGAAYATIVNSTNVGAPPGSNGALNVRSGGMASGTVVNSGGIENISASATDFVATVNAGGDLFVYSGGTTVSAQVVGSGPTNRAFEILSGGTASGCPTMACWRSASAAWRSTPK
jgi:autotransporter passenger strand-loop-strand repeat protein